MRITVLGCSPVQPNPGEACSGYLLQTGKRSFLVDAGSGVISALLEYEPLSAIESVFITHAHPDHCQDLVTLRQSLAHGPGPHSTSPVPVYASAETVATLRALGKAFGNADLADDFWNRYIDFQVIDRDTHLKLGGLCVRFEDTEHYLPTLALRFETQSRSVVFGADSGPCEALATFAGQADLLLAEATLPSRDGHEEDWGHMTAAEAGDLAERAGVRALRLVHYFVEHDALRVARDASARFSGDARAARPGDVYVL